MKGSVLCWVVAATLAACCVPAVRQLADPAGGPGQEPGPLPNAEIALGKLVLALVLDGHQPAATEAWGIVLASPEHAELASDLARYPPVWREGAMRGAPDLPDSGSSYARAARLRRAFEKVLYRRRGSVMSGADYSRLLDQCEDLVSESAVWNDHRADYLRALASYLQWCGASPLATAASLTRVGGAYRYSSPFQHLSQVLQWSATPRQITAKTTAPAAVAMRAQDLGAAFASRMVPLDNARVTTWKALRRVSVRTSHRMAEPRQMLSLLGSLLALAAVALVAGILVARASARAGQEAPPAGTAGRVTLVLMAVALVASTAAPVMHQFDLENHRLAQALLLTLALAFALRRRMRPWPLGVRDSRIARCLQALPALAIAAALTLGSYRLLMVAPPAASTLVAGWPAVWGVVSGVVVLGLLAAWGRPRVDSVRRLRRLVLALTVIATLVVSATGVSRGDGGGFLFSPMGALPWLALWLVGYGAVAKALGRRGHRDPAVTDWPLAVTILSIAALAMLAGRLTFDWPLRAWERFEQYIMVDFTALLCLLPILRSAWAGASPEDGKPSPEAVARTQATARTLAQGALILALILAAATAYGYHVVNEETQVLQAMHAAGF